MSSRSEMQQLVRKLEKQGFVVTRTGSGHWMVKHPNGGPQVILAFSPRGAGQHKSLARLRDIGYVG